MLQLFILLSALLSAATISLIAQASDCDDVVFGLPYSGRPVAELDRLLNDGTGEEAQPLSRRELIELAKYTFNQTSIRKNNYARSGQPAAESFEASRTRVSLLIQHPDLPDAGLQQLVLALHNLSLENSAALHDINRFYHGNIASKLGAIVKHPEFGPHAQKAILTELSSPETSAKFGRKDAVEHYLTTFLRLSPVSENQLLQIIDVIKRQPNMPGDVKSKLMSLCLAQIGKSPRAWNAMVDLWRSNFTALSNEFTLLSTMIERAKKIDTAATRADGKWRPGSDQTAVFKTSVKEFVEHVLLTRYSLDPKKSFALMNEALELKLMSGESIFKMSLKVVELYRRGEINWTLANEFLSYAEKCAFQVDGTHQSKNITRLIHSIEEPKKLPLRATSKKSIWGEKLLDSLESSSKWQGFVQSLSSAPAQVTDNLALIGKTIASANEVRVNNAADRKQVKDTLNYLVETFVLKKDLKNPYDVISLSKHAVHSEYIDGRLMLKICQKVAGLQETSKIETQEAIAFLDEARTMAIIIPDPKVTEMIATLRKRISRQLPHSF